MPGPNTYSFERYLETKRTVDERALNRRVRGRLQAELRDVSAPLRVLEIGSGIGATIERVLAWRGPPEGVQYTAVDVDGELVDRTRERLHERSRDRPFEVHERDGTLELQRGERQLSLDLIVRDALEFAADTDRTWDLLIGQAFLDLTDVRSALATLRDAVRPGGFLYFPITFDGATILEPTIDRAFDGRIERRYHDHMEAGGGDSRAGRHLLTDLPAVGCEVLAAGSSDWIVRPAGSVYPADEAYFLHHIVEMIHGALADDPELPSERFDEWIAERHRQIENGELVYVAHQLDVLGRRP